MIIVAGDEHFFIHKKKILFKNDMSRVSPGYLKVNVEVRLLHCTRERKRRGSNCCIVQFSDKTQVLHGNCMLQSSADLLIYVSIYMTD